MKTINIIIDYKGRFGTKFTAKPYRSGFDKLKLANYFKENGYTVNFIYPWQVDFNNCKNQLYLYTSSEDNYLHYKSYLEDIVLGLKLAGAIVIPDYHYLRAHHNKVLMEIIRKISNDKNIKTIDSHVYGTVEELISSKNIYSNKSAYVIKPSEGAMSKGISLAKDFKQLLADAKKISATPSLIIDLIDRMRALKHKGYIKESTHRKKFVVQDFIPNLQGDWKVLIYWNKFYVLRRLNREKDFRASGGGRLSYTRDIPNGMLDYAKSIIKHLNLPNVSLDIAFDGKTFYLLEFQAVYFGTYTLEHSSFYFSFNKEWEIVEKESILEDEYVRSIISYIDNDFKYLE